ncbi:hypothetical protein E0Z10_g183 [Xylaria hypoxylon]|uniref:Uncharacterized protein n=1 Tax=Xylaria hypoxylon TaxID=37992 RepID=A0A4Z0Z9Z4_9PEZI|nr:hypothetical protein E0Z10_g183 [Xylaria hypoxylon]
MPNVTPEYIITIIGVPLAVLGVLPILYNTLSTLAALSKIKRMLRHGKLTALTRSDIINRVIEVELPRYAVQPWDRFHHRERYWQISRQPSSIPGGSWTTFNWKTNTIGIKTQRVEYADQLRQPQVDIEFHELVAYLLDLGAVPDVHGWRLLRSTGLWTPTGCSLMKNPRGTHVVLAMAPLEDSDGHLSLKVAWEPSWTTRDASTLPPYWVRLPPPPDKEPEEKPSASQEIVQSEETSDVDKTEEEPDKKKESSPKESLDSIQKQAERNATAPITCQFSVDGLQSALSQNQGPPISTVFDVHSLHIEHLRINSLKMNGKWFASAATAYGTTSQTVLWNYKIPDEILAFARRDSVPCGVLELLGVVDSSLTPQWETKYNDGMEQHEAFVRRSQEQRIAMAAELRMDAGQRQLAGMQRRDREMMQNMNEMRDRTIRDTQRRETRRHEALQSPKWDTKLVAEHSLAWLKQRKTVDSELALRDVVGTVLHRMVLDGEFASAIFEMLDVWKAWTDNGGMRNADLDILQSRFEAFAHASLLVTLIKDATTADEGTLSMDLQECMRMWRVVRLG